MNSSNNEQIQSNDGYAETEQDAQSQESNEEDLLAQAQDDEYDYNREPPLDAKTVTSNRGRSKYVFTTLCFLVALVLFYTHLNGMFASDTSSSWFPLVAAVILLIAGISFLLSPDTVPEKGMPEAEQRISPAKTREQPLDPFEELIQEALATLPAEFAERMENLSVHAVYEPDAEVLKRAGVKEGHVLLGLYEGVPLTSYGRHHTSHPETITIYQRTIEDYCQHDPERIRAQVHATVLHEIAHHFGMGHEEMPIWVK